jgi:hypothetical protein
MLLLASLFLTIAVGEWLFPKFMGKIPLRLYGLVDKKLRILAQRNFPHKFWEQPLSNSYCQKKAC